MKERVYLETSFIGYLTSRRQRNVIVAAKQTLTQEWWDGQRHLFDLFVSQIVIDEICTGDPIAIQERLQVVTNIPVLDVQDKATQLADELLLQAALPAKAANDALHIAIAAANAMHYLLTWNCKHIANATMIPVIQLICKQHGLQAPILCTPEELRRQVRP